jgi:hypothetical protein
MDGEYTNLFQKMLTIETKDFFLDLKKNRNGVYLKISERSKGQRNTVRIELFTGI